MNLASFETTDKKLKKEQTLEGNSWEWVIRAIQMWTWREVIGLGRVSLERASLFTQFPQQLP